ncbi:MAG TPA: hypothetical protein VGA36_00670 [Nitriliruptorales bacterium]
MKRNRPDRCERVRARLPALIADELPWWRRLAERHVARCAGCTDELTRQRRVAEQLARLNEAVSTAVADEPAPDDLLNSLLEQARDPGLRARAAVPARGAISGARPGLSVAFAMTILAVIAAAGWVGWRIGRTWSSRH